MYLCKYPHPYIDLLFDIALGMWRFMNGFWNGNLTFVLMIIACLFFIERWRTK
jgi:hypothetical protein